MTDLLESIVREALNLPRMRPTVDRIFEVYGDKAIDLFTHHVFVHIHCWPNPIEPKPTKENIRNEVEYLLTDPDAKKWRKEDEKH